ncbi:hypothetical protein O0I10_007763 [Lichtheimia ornata]|uniref:Heterokaryon incompatibility domain-containing protein n=1 Tax=Lichtheimia ornata TaxID=688661 RepID=A0AAD7V074_9FUNG|nr:uncharacterized protein O0I10_007763 [Lichtheimia ornata]KAJ8656440.1 hypothetical protein O0I10_007763 [Lichtheimia ornata]
MTITSTSKDPSAADIEFGKLWTLEDTFTHQDFRLLYVPPKDEDEKMMIITPSKHDASYVPDRKFYALSHLWGTDPKDNLWDVSDFISDEDGTTVEPIPMRKEKRETFLKLLQENPGYWWVDVLCCRTDTPPVIMRGVYGCCEKCFAMIDCPSKAIEYFSVVLPQFEIHDESKAIIELNVARMRWEALHPTETISSFLLEGCKHAMAIWKCRWFSRVWTMQELALPSSVMLLSETGGMSYSISADSLSSLLLHLWRMCMLQLNVIGDEVDNVAYFEGHVTVLRDTLHNFHGLEKRSKKDRFENLEWLLAQLASSERSCYFAEDYVYGVLGILGWDIPRLDFMKDLWDRFLFSFQRVAEKAFSESIIFIYDDYDPCGEAKIKHCLETFHFHIYEEARSCPLSGACTMADVYQNLLYIKVDCSCAECEVVVEQWLADVCAYFKIIRNEK